MTSDNAKVVTENPSLRIGILRLIYTKEEGKTSMVKTMSFDRLTGIALGRYYLERYIGQSRLGPTFLARTSSASPCLVRFLEEPMTMTPQEHAIYLEQFQDRARQIAALQHPSLLPLQDYGVYQGLPYLVSPHLPLRSLRSRLAKLGTLDLFTVGRYLDQMATALEYAHGHGVLHGGLSIDSIFTRLDGNLVLADVGVKSLLELYTQGVSGPRLLEWSDGYAPEQLLGKPSSAATDVYALGVIVFYLLTNRDVFADGAHDTRIQQHLHSPVPQLNELRSDLPSGIYNTVVRALAKDPDKRYQQPGAFANAFHRSMNVADRMRLPFIVSEPLSPEEARITPVTENQRRDVQVAKSASSNNDTGIPDQSARASHTQHGIAGERMVDSRIMPRPGLILRMAQKRRRRLLPVVGVAVLVFVLLASGITAFVQLAQKNATRSTTTGQVTFFATQENTDEQTNALRISISHLAAPPAGSIYQGWILNDSTEGVTGLGPLTEQGAVWSLTFQTTISNLLAVGDKLEITQEQGNVSAPTGHVILEGSFPVMAFAHIQHLLVSFPLTPGKVGMLIGLVQQSHLLDSQATVLESVASSRNIIATGCVTQSMLDIIQGINNPHYQPLTDVCSKQYDSVTGDGFGLLGKGFVAGAEEHASLALAQKDATDSMHQHAALMDIALSNIAGWVTSIEQDLLHLQARPSDLALVQQIATLADAAYYGVDTNGDGRIDPVTGEAGAITAYQQGQLMAALTLAPA